MKKYNKWNEERLAELAQDYATIADTAIIAKKYNINQGSLKTVCAKNKIKRGRKFLSIWTDEESAILEKEYATADLEELAKRLGKTLHQIRGRAYRLVLYRDRKKK